jgi:hypothetical protein
LDGQLASYGEVQRKMNTVRLRRSEVAICNRRFLSCLVGCLEITFIVAILVVYITTDGLQCDAPLREWLLVLLAISILHFMALILL